MTDTIIHRLEANARRYSGPAYHDRLSGTWKATSWSEFNTETRTVARAMRALGLERGSVVTILAPNRPEWTLAALGAMRIGGISAGIYTSNSPAEVAYIVEHAESPLIVVDSAQQLAKIVDKWDELPDLKYVVMMAGAEGSDDPRVLTWDEFLARAEESDDAELDAIADSLGPDDVADFIYTSGTTGPPKAVMLTHENLAWTADALAKVVPSGPDDVMLSYLPLSHIAEQTATIHLAITNGYQVYYCPDGLKLAEYLREVEPTIFFGVPRVWERFASVVTDNLSQATGAKAKIAEWARSIGRQTTELRNKGESPSGLLAVQHAIAEKLFFSTVRQAMGLTRQRALISGAAPIPPATLDFFASLDMTILEIYGQSEDTGPTTTNRPGAVKYGSVGQPIDGVEVKLADNDEILVRGKNVFAGYYKNEAATAETLVDGWLHSGDLGRFDEDGFLYITGRSKDIIITSGGKNIAPRNLEEALTGIDVVSQAVCIGEQQRYLVALVTLDPEACQRFAEERGLSVDGLNDDPTMREYLDAEIQDKVNAHFARVEHIRNFAVLPHEFSVETGELTPTFKIKRTVVNEMYADTIAEVYSAGQLL